MHTPKPTQQEIEELISFLPRLYKPGFSPVRKWHGGDKNDEEVITMEWPEYEPVVDEFIQAASAECWTDPDYLSEPAAKILDDEYVIKTADLSQIKTMLTFCVRGERFCDGHWGSVMGIGVL